MKTSNNLEGLRKGAGLLNKSYRKALKSLEKALMQLKTVFMCPLLFWH